MAAVARPQTPEPLSILEGKGLHKSGNWLLLPEELQFAQDLHDGYTKKTRLRQAREQARRAEASAQSSKLDLARLIAQLSQIQRRLAAARSAREHNALLPELNAVTAKIMGLQAVDHEKKAREAWTAVSGLIGDFTQAVLKLRRQYDALPPRYADLAQDPQVKAALAQLNQPGAAPYALGPNASQEKRLASLESLVLADSVPIRRGRDGLWHVSVIWNGKGTVEMAIDSGATVCVLPMQAAREVGITAGPGAPVSRMTLANGSRVDARIVVAESLRVGRFVAENVECAIMPEELKDVPPLLGQSFLQRFQQTIDAAHGRWELVSLQDPANPQAASFASQATETSSANRPRPDPTELLRRLLAVPDDDPRSARAVEVRLDGGAMTFRAGRQYEAAGLKQLLGEPRAVRNPNLPGHADWELWTWGKVQVLIDPQGMTRYYTLVEK
jgi:clan AA aspartic protease (TIGR02281 family)